LEKGNTNGNFEKKVVPEMNFYNFQFSFEKNEKPKMVKIVKKVIKKKVNKTEEVSEESNKEVSKNDNEKEKKMSLRKFLYLASR